jgi:hypothetical protein
MAVSYESLSIGANFSQAFPFLVGVTRIHFFDLDSCAIRQVKFEPFDPISSDAFVSSHFQLHDSDVSRMANLTPLAPEIVAAILDETLQPEVTLFDVAARTPVVWVEQRKKRAGKLMRRDPNDIVLSHDSVTRNKYLYVRASSPS